MAYFVKKWKAFQKTKPGKLFELVIYLIMMLLTIIYFTGNGTFIYETL